MSEWITNWTEASLNADKGLAIIDGLMEYASNRRGNPAKKERALYLSSITFAYAVWENYLEEVAIELAGHLAGELRPEQMTRPDVRALIEKDASVWDLAVHPGWRVRWVDAVTAAAKGGENAGFGINTANFKNSRKLFDSIGISRCPTTARRNWTDSSPSEARSCIPPQLRRPCTRQRSDSGKPSSRTCKKQ